MTSVALFYNLITSPNDQTTDWWIYVWLVPNLLPFACTEYLKSNYV